MTESFQALYPHQLDAQKQRYETIKEGFSEYFGNNRDFSYFSAPGRTEIGGNHTDHNRGCVLAAAVNLDIVAAAAKNDENVIRLKSIEYEKMDVIDLSDLSVQESEKERSSSLLRGICARCKQLGYQIGGFDAFTMSQVLKGSGLSSSASFEVLAVTIISHLYNDGAIDPITAAQISQYAENVYFGKPSGLMDQMASSVGGFTAIDFRDPEKPVLEKVSFSLDGVGYAMCIVDTGGSHADLTSDYASIPSEMKAVATLLGCEHLREADEAEFFRRLGEIRKQTGDRAALRAIHFFADNRRAQEEAHALKGGNFEYFKELILESGDSSAMYLQNAYSIKDPQSQGVSLALAVSERILRGKGAWRIHGGGFGGTMQAFVPLDLVPRYKAEIESVFGKDTCHILSIRNAGGVKVSL
ncbi:galactokinase [Yeguia hominis]|uniref:Galactokinase n=1 Tax=Yeguia hominis TaxID=2763662 RepID=A0A926D718_9FIRM|nr:galactokinase family protein [Yeguia hominis]MBC8532436.1 galactokinase [Yeguia hominis]